MKEKTEESFEKRKKREKILFTFVNITLWASVVIIGILILIAPNEVLPSDSFFLHEKSYYYLMFSESVLGVICMNLPRHIEKNWGVEIPSRMLVPFVIFLYCAIFLGEVRSFYYNVPHWDKLLHLFSAMMLGALGYSIISILNSSKKVPIHLSPAFVAIFAFCFALSCGALWEIYEYTFDGLFGMNMQKFMLEDGTQLIGHAAVADTMNDIITDTIGAAAMALFGYFSMKKYPRKWLSEMQLQKKDAPKTTESTETN